MCPKAKEKTADDRNSIGGAFIAWSWGTTYDPEQFKPNTVDPTFTLPRYRTGGYAVNGWVAYSAAFEWPDPNMDLRFQNESQLAHPMETPVAADAVFLYGFPVATDFPQLNLDTGVRDNYRGGRAGMDWFLVPRHGLRPASIPRRWPISERLPGAINVTFFDGHTEQVQLERLWQLYWHRDYEPPAKRPGLK